VIRETPDCRTWSKILTIRLNGEPYDIAGPVSISALLAALNIDPRIVAVEHNVVVVKRQSYDDTIVNDGDEVEIVRFVGGGLI
jgi:thiamine biosynthesis protein ThiS